MYGSVISSGLDFAHLTCAGEHLLLGDRALPAPPSQEGNGPVRDDREALLEPGQEGQVHHQPQQPGGKPGDTKRPDGGNRAEPGDCGHRAQVAVAERAIPMVAVKAADDRASGMDAGLHRHLGHPGQVVQAHQIAHDEDLGMARQCAVGQPRHAAGAIDRGLGLLGQDSAEGRCLYAGRPDLGARLDAPGRVVGLLDVETVLVDAGDQGLQPHLDPEPFQILPDAALERFGKLASTVSRLPRPG